jgi:NADPH-dependent curcumin reductase CurA
MSTGTSSSEPRGNDERSRSIPSAGLEVRLVARVVGWPSIADFTVVKHAVPVVGVDEVMIRNRVMSVDPYLRNVIGDASAAPGQPLGGSSDG